ncbi:MAG: hypothetical protein DME23_13570 [Verrucomicrobia bacterium]|nr:MAG: hypothetical protein DME23_13570 [Verrucomicrobiota bacterium]
MAKPSPKPFFVKVTHGQTAEIIVRKGKRNLYTHKLKPGAKISFRVGKDYSGTGDSTISPSKKP